MSKSCRCFGYLLALTLSVPLSALANDASDALQTITLPAEAGSDLSVELDPVLVTGTRDVVYVVRDAVGDVWKLQLLSYHDDAGNAAHLRVEFAPLAP